ncbi:unnamed protein product [Chrysodeixis includens]|uniref:Uncharacterized protein n=1 Tax=Chrysodeixis includens TaxID=689277 RepID=A0A9N8KRJ3_CHRIL|nr:unnamed protein product [Chrysodeixis includens]
MAQDWALSDVLKYFQEDPEIKGVLNATEFKSLVNPDNNFLKTLKSALEYQGIRSDTIPANRFSNYEPLSRDLNFLIMMFLLRNNHISKIIQKSIQGLSNILEMLKEKIRSDTIPANRFSNYEPLSRDLNFLIMMFLLRNNHISKIIQKSIQGLSNILEMLKEKIRSDTIPANRFSNYEPLSRDLNFLIMMFLLRNNHISKIIQKSIQGLSNILEMLKEKRLMDLKTQCPVPTTLGHPNGGG